MKTFEFIFTTPKVSILVSCILLLMCFSTFLSAQKNVALGKKAYQSSTYSPAGKASNAVDGNRNGTWTFDEPTNSLSHTGNESNPYWEVDLGADYNITSVVIYNRTDCCSERLDNFLLTVKPNHKKTDLRYAPSVTHADNRYIFSGNKVGRYVRVQLQRPEYLTLAEVEVYGTPVITPTSTSTSTPTNANTDGAIVEDRSQKLYLHVATGNRSGAGTDAHVYANIIYKNGTKDRIKLDKPGYDDFEAGDFDKYDLGVSLYHLSEIANFNLELVGNGTSGSDWYVEGARFELQFFGRGQAVIINQWLESDTSTLNLY